MLLNQETFKHRYRQLVYLTKKKGSEPSFTSGLWFDEEGYKYDFWEKAQAELQLETWLQLTDSEIVKLAIKPLGILMRGSYRRQNLVSEPNYMKVIDIFYENGHEAAETLKAVFFGNDDRVAFDRFAKLLTKKAMSDPISVASLFFFLKNKEEYAVAHKQGTGEKLNKLGLNAACVQKCTWVGYQEYISIVKEIKSLLPAELNATLLDAQSFLWMMWMVEENTPEYVDEELEFHDFANGTVNIQKEQWINLIRNGTITETDIAYLAKFYASPNHASTPKRLSELEGTHPSSYISPCTSLGRKISQFFLIPSIPREGKPDSEKLYPIIFLGRRISNGLFEWKLRPELVAALEETSPQTLAAETVRMEENEEEEAAQLSVDELLDRARKCHSGPADTYTSTTKQRRRNPLMQLAAKARANGVCQLCGITLDYKDKQGRPYLEAHHIIPLAENGPDELSNMTALCPNCHRKMHVVADRDDIARLLALAEF